MQTLSLRKPALIGLILTALFVGVFSSRAFAATKSTQSSLAGCNTLEVTLHGQQAPTSRCLVQTGTIQPAINAHHCGTDTNDFALYWNSPINAPSVIPRGPVLCIRGSGSLPLNLNQTLDGRNWNDQASAFWAGCSDGLLFSDINGGGSTAAFFANESTNFPYSSDGAGGVIQNDALSSISLSSNC